jgi:hypothetical protein
MRIAKLERLALQLSIREEPIIIGTVTITIKMADDFCVEPVQEPAENMGDVPPDVEKRKSASLV